MEDFAAHEKYMSRCLQLAASGSGNVAPNPMVGAVLVHNDIVIGEGFHQKFGDAHAEINCINSVSDNNRSLISASTLYVSLEPCCHTGKTPPCSDAILKAGINKIVVACSDPYEKVNGSGIKILRNAGVVVVENILKEQAEYQNKRFFTFHRKQRPYIILKWARSKNNFISEKNKRTKISNEITDRLVHKWRSEEAAILVGKNTALVDDPALTTRYFPGNNPVRILIDRFLSVPAANKILSDENPTIIINTIKQHEEGNKIYYKAGEDENLVAVVINLLHQRNLTSLIVEGGNETISYFLESGIWDEARVITGDIMITDGTPAPEITGRKKKEERIKNDTIEYFVNDKA